MTSKSGEVYFLPLKTLLKILRDEAGDVVAAIGKEVGEFISYTGKVEEEKQGVKNQDEMTKMLWFIACVSAAVIVTLLAAIILFVK